MNGVTVAGNGQQATSLGCYARSVGALPAELLAEVDDR